MKISKQYGKGNLYSTNWRKTRTECTKLANELGFFQPNFSLRSRPDWHLIMVPLPDILNFYIILTCNFLISA